MQKLFAKRKIMIGAGVLLFLFSLNLVSSPVRGLAVSLVAPLQISLWQAGRDISLSLGGGSVRVENEVLREENLALLSELVALKNVERENEELRRILNLELAAEVQMVMGEVIGKNLTTDVLTIRGGQNQGIRKGMPVMTSGKVAVGRVVESFPDYANVQLLSATQSRVDAQIGEGETTGVVRGQGGQKLLLDLVPQEDKLHVGDLVVTSNFGDLFPKHFLIGEITEILTTGPDPFQKAKLQPFFHVKSLERVFVIISLASPDLPDVRP